MQVLAAAAQAMGATDLSTIGGPGKSAGDRTPAADADWTATLRGKHEVVPLPLAEIKDGTFTKRLIEDDGVRGVTSNPTIFEKAIGGSEDEWAAQWAPKALRLPEAHALATGAGVRVALLDSGAEARIAAGNWRRRQMPAYHLMAEDGPGITLVNIGVGPSNAKTICDHLAVTRPHAWMMIGHCGGLRPFFMNSVAMVVPAVHTIMGSNRVVTDKPS